MSVRDTSLEVYHRIKQDGILSKRRFEVYEILFNHGPLTSGEVFNHSDLKYITGYRCNVSARLNELREMNVVKEIGTRQCSTTGNTAILWDVTSNFPLKIEKRKSSKQIIRELSLECMQLRAENAQLKTLLKQQAPHQGTLQGLLF